MRIKLIIKLYKSLLLNMLSLSLEKKYKVIELFFVCSFHINTFYYLGGAGGRNPGGGGPGGAPGGGGRKPIGGGAPGIGGLNPGGGGRKPGGGGGYKERVSIICITLYFLSLSRYFSLLNLPFLDQEVQEEQVDGHMVLEKLDSRV